MTQLPRAPGFDDCLPLLPPQNHLDSMNGGLEEAVLGRVEGESPEAFKRRLYGRSFELREICEEIYFECRRVTELREEVFIGGYSHIQPKLKISTDGDILVDSVHAREKMAQTVQFFGATALFYGDWLVIGADAELTPVEIGDRDDQGYRKVMLRVTPRMKAEAGDSQSIAVIANPLLYIPTPEEIETIARIRMGILADAVESFGSLTG